MPPNRPRDARFPPVRIRSLSARRPRFTPQQVTRTVALVVDDLSLSFGSLVCVREALRKFVQQQMLPCDLVALVRTGGVAILEQFTGDPAGAQIHRPFLRRPGPRSARATAGLSVGLRRFRSSR